MGVLASISLVLLAILGAGAGLLALAPILRVPYPILLVLGGLALGFVPGIPHVALRPDVVLVAILPPLLYSSAFFTSLRDLRRNVRPLSLLGIPRRLATLIEGESLINDATALVAYGFAVVAVTTGTFSFWHATWRFAVDV